jgi:hypothetical protein
MKQLDLFPLDWRIVIPLDPQPYQAGRFEPIGGPCCIGDWIWNYRPGHHLVSTHPEKGKGYFSVCPFKPGMSYQEGVIENVELKLISNGWVWVLHLREVNDTDLTPYWDMLRGRPEPKNCQWPEETDDL